jgi:miniconductance mechanosensitive channel
VVRAFESALTTQDSQEALDGIVRFIRGMIISVTVVLIGAALTGNNPLVVIGSLGVFMAVFVVLFRDSLLGLVASVQIVSNNIVNVGDWIEMPKYEADGDVLSISLNMIKVENFDKTISTVPTHTVLSESFRNWSTIHEAGGRRIKRAIFIDMHSIRPCSPEMTARFQKVISDVSTCMDGDNSEVELDRQFATNIGAFRKYIVEYLQSIDDLHERHEMTFLVRHLHPTAQGLPLEIYAFCRKTDWIKYEEVQAEILEHLLSVLSEFDLRVFQDQSDMPTERVEAK